MRNLISALNPLSLRNVWTETVVHLPIPLAQTKSGGGGSPHADKAYDAYGCVGTLHAIVSQLSNGTAGPKWRLFRASPGREASRRPEVTSHALLNVWNSPNPFYTRHAFIETCQQHLDLVGETCILLVDVGGIIVEMWPVRPDMIKPIKDPVKFISGYLYKSPDGEEIPLATSQIMRIMYPNPKDPYRGMGPVQSVLHDIDASKYSAEWNRNFFINGAQPGGIIEVDHRMGDEEFNAFLTRWRQQHQGVANAHRVAVLENATWKDAKFSMEEMQFAELRNLPRELIREAFAFPKPMLGTVDDVNRANAEAGRAILAEGHIKPRLDRWQDAINAYLLPRFANGANLVFEYDDPTPVNREAANAERTSKASAVATLVGAGFDPSAVLEICGLPDMPFKGVQSPTTTPTMKK
jgi:HK97 family phage portal protein